MGMGLEMLAGIGARTSLAVSGAAVEGALGSEGWWGDDFSVSQLCSRLAGDMGSAFLLLGFASLCSSVKWE